MGEIKHNKLNDLGSAPYMKFTKSWFICNPPPRRGSVLVHPAKFPETLCQQFIEFFTKAGQTVLDPMCGTGSAVLAAVRSGRKGVGIELLEKYAEIAEAQLAQEYEAGNPDQGTVIVGDAQYTPSLLEGAGVGVPVDYVLTSPPYWDMLRRAAVNAERKDRERRKDWDMYYSDDPDDLGNIDDYEMFLEALDRVYRQVAEVLRPGAYMTIIAKNLKKGGTMYPLAWDLARMVGKYLDLKDERIWCQDNVTLFPFALGSAWVSNVHHHTCLQFRKPEVVRP
jgi:DNA modification methylase